MEMARHGAKHQKGEIRMFIQLIAENPGMNGDQAAVLHDLGGGRIVECPAVLEVRLLGRSKMKTLRTVFGHLRLLTRFAVTRIAGGGATDPATVEIPGLDSEKVPATDSDVSTKEHTPVS